MFVTYKNEKESQCFSVQCIITFSNSDDQWSSKISSYCFETFVSHISYIQAVDITRRFTRAVYSNEIIIITPETAIKLIVSNSTKYEKYI